MTTGDGFSGEVGAEASRSYRYVADKTYPDRMGRAYFGTLAKGPGAVLLGLIVIVLLAAQVLAGRIWNGVLPIVIALILFVWLVRRRSSRPFLRSTPPGTVIEATFDATTLSTAVGAVRASVPLSSIHRMKVTDAAVFFRVGLDRITRVLPREVFPDEEIARVRAPHSW